ncbi:MAG: C25 family cysteine peptidase [Kiritimatiellia bacterium]
MTDDDRELFIDNVTVTEGDAGTTNAVFTVTLSSTNSVDATLDFASSNGTAIADGDYLATNGTLTITAGQSNGTITVVVNGDTFDEGISEKFFVNLSNANNAHITDGQGEGTITDDDAGIPEARYMRSDQHTINSLTTYNLATNQSSSGQSTLIESTGGGDDTINWGIRVWKRDSAGAETEITSGTPVAQVSRSANGAGVQSANWNCPQTSLTPSDSVVIRVYAEISGQVAWTQQASFVSEQLNAVELSAATWTVYYYTKYSTDGSTYTQGWFYWGNSTYNSRIENFTRAFESLIDISGTIYTDEAKSGTIASNKTVALSVNGGAVQTFETTVGGAFSFTNVTVSVNAALLLYIDGEIENGSLVTVVDGVTDLTGTNALEMFTDKIVLEYVSGNFIDNGILDIVDGVDGENEDGISVSGGMATFANGFELWIEAGKTYQPDNSITADDIQIEGRLVGTNSAAVTISGNWVNNGTFSHNQCSIMFDGDTEISGVNTSAFHNVTVSGNLVGHSNTVTISGNWDSSAGFYTNNSGTIVFSGTSTQTVSTGGAWDPATTNNNWKNNWYEIEVQNTNSVIFADGFSTTNFTCSTPGATLFFKYQEEVTNVFEITAPGGLTLAGASGNLIKLRRYGGSDAATNRWEIVPEGGGWSVSYVDVSYSVNSMSSNDCINPSASVDSGYNLNWFISTLVKLSDFYAEAYDDRVVLYWETGAEVNNAGFCVYRSSVSNGPYKQLNTTLIRGLGNSVVGQAYSYVDPVSDGTNYYYKLESLEFDYTSDLYGPIVPVPGTGEPDPLPEGNGPPQDNPPPPGGNSGIYKVFVEEDGIYRLDYDYMASVVTNLGSWFPENIRMYNMGADIPVRVCNEGTAEFGTNDYIEFYGFGLDTRFTDRNVYWLYHATNSSGLKMGQSGVTGGITNDSTPYVKHFEKDEYYEPALPDEFPDDDHWFFSDYIYVCYGETNSINLHPVINSVSDVDTTATVRVALRGLTAFYHVEFEMNGTPLAGAADWTGLDEFIYISSVPQTNLLEGTNILTLTLIAGPETFYEEVLINWIELDYIRNLEACDENILFQSRETGTKHYNVSSFTNADVDVFKVTDPWTVSVVTNVNITGSGPFTAGFAEASVSGTVFVAASSDGRKTPAGIIEDSSSYLRSTGNSADYIIITHYSFFDAIQPLADFHANRGLRVKTVKVQDIYDDFNYGIFDPNAIRDFLVYARNNWGGDPPAYVLLVGDGTCDYKSTEYPTYVPAKFIHDLDSWEVPSDNWYVSLDSVDDIVPDMSIGRFPARSAGEAATMVNKTLAYAASDAEKPWARRIMLVADEGDSYFEDICEGIEAYVPSGYIPTNIYRRLYSSAADASADITNGFNRGALITVYAGHGSFDEWSSMPPLVDNTDVGNLTNAPRLPVVITPTCFNGYFANPAWAEGLAEELVRSSNGAVVCVSPSGQSWPQHQWIFGHFLATTIMQGNVFDIGKAVKHASGMTFDLLGEDSRNIIQTTVYFGDPALTLKKWSGYDETLWYGPLASDSDGDGMSDGWEINYSLDSEDADDAADDADGDGLSNLEEYYARTSPLLQDTDGDGLDDFKEINVYNTDPLKNDTDGDGMADGDEVIAGTDPDNENDVFLIDSLGLPGTNMFTLSCNSFTNRWYILQTGSDLTGTNGWRGVLTNSGTGGELVFTNTPVEANLFYRIEVRLK